MTRIDNTQKMWRGQCRKSRAHKWVNKGLFETRADARERCATYRDCFVTEQPSGKFYEPFGFGNTRVIPYVKAKKGQGK